VKPLIWIAACAALSASCEALAVGTLANVTVIDRESGAPIRACYFRGEYWVAGRPGARYAIEIRNRTGGRLLAVTSVDGVNVLSGATAAWEQTGYVFDSFQDYQISGWRKSHEEVAAFTFTDSPSSYAARTGRVANVGVIGVALFKEALPRAYVAPQISEPEAPLTRSASGERAAAGETASPAPATPPGIGADRAQELRAPGAVARESTPAAKLGTGHGEREYSYVVDTEFRRMRDEPDEVIRIRYDSLENLVSMGVIHRPRPAPVPNAFPDSQPRQFVPDPPG
jgi:hypothetical protein